MRIHRTFAPALLAVLLTAPAGAASITLSAAEFHNADGTGHTFSAVGGWLSVGGGTGCMVAPVDLPDGAELTTVTAWVVDEQVGSDFAVELVRKRRGNSVPAETVSLLLTSGATAGLRTLVDTAPQNRVVDDVYVYYLTTAVNCMDSGSQKIYGVRIDYRQSIFADGFETGDTSAWTAPPSSLRSAWIPGAAFSSAYKNESWAWSFDSDLGTFVVPNASGVTPPCGVAPLELPHGATLTGFLANLYDARTDRGLTLDLLRSPVNSMVVPSVLASASTAATTGWQLRSDLSVTDPVVDNDSFWYFFRLCVTGGNTVAAGELGAQAVQVIYTLP